MFPARAPHSSAVFTLRAAALESRAPAFAENHGAAISIKVLPCKSFLPFVAAFPFALLNCATPKRGSETLVLETAKPGKRSQTLRYFRRRYITEQTWKHFVASAEGHVAIFTSSENGLF